jgi:hypothetical protein
MHPDSPQWMLLLACMAGWGRDHAAQRVAPPTDQHLWATAHAAAPDLLPDAPDPDMLRLLREAYTGGHDSLIDLQALADILNERGHQAVIEHTGGGTATLYAGHLAADRHGDPRWSAAVGPGWFNTPGFGAPMADRADFYLGPDADDTWFVTVTATDSLGDIADIITTVIAHVEARRAHFAQAAAAARDAMWATFTSHYPHIRTGDLAPDTDQTFTTASTTVLLAWLDANDPDIRTVAPQLHQTPDHHDPEHRSAQSTSDIAAVDRRDEGDHDDPCAHL